MEKYLQLAGKNPATTRHAVDKLIPTQTQIEHSGPGGDPIALQVQLIAAILGKT